METIQNYSSRMQSFYAYASPVKVCIKCALNGPNHGHLFFFKRETGMNREKPSDMRSPQWQSMSLLKLFARSTDFFFIYSLLYFFFIISFIFLLHK